MAFNVVLAAAVIALLAFHVAGVAALVPPAYCTRVCGGVAIPYPFGVDIENGCQLSDDRQGFKLACRDFNRGRGKRLYYYNNEVLDISLQKGQVRWLNSISSFCYNATAQGMEDTGEFAHLDLNGAIFRISPTANKFTVIGCNTLAYISEKANDTSHVAECKATCNSGNHSSPTTGACEATAGCCQIPTPSKLENYHVSFDNNFTSTAPEMGTTACSYAALIEESNFTFSTSYLTSAAFMDTYGYGGQAPMVLDWAVGTLHATTCETAKANQSTYACVSNNSVCVDSPNIGGYTCNCSQGYQGNPYLRDGCLDVNECDDKINCDGTCHNTMENFNCCHRETKYDPSKNECSSTKKRGPNIGVIIGVGAGLGMLVIGLGAIFFFCRWKRDIKKQQRNMYYRKNHGLLLEQLISSNKNASDGRMIFSLEELEKATNNFDETHIVGRGGHGMVYKGILSDQRVVAIKKSKLVKEAEINEFINEVVILSQINHRNIVKLYGCCLETEVPLLVSDYIHNGSLFEILHGESVNGLPLSWDHCLRIALEAAGALCYLHTSASISVFHRDVKSSNILLDGNYTAKVADFGASRAVPIHQTHVTTNVQGTYGYLDPEYHQTGQLNEKSDVYSFGVVLLELLTRKKPVFSNADGDHQNLSSYFLSQIKLRPVREVVSTQVLQEANEDEINTVSSLAEMCLRLQGKERPTMKQVESTLQYLRTKRVAASQIIEGGDDQIEPSVTSYQPLEIHMANIGHSESSSNFLSME
ncbi:unnamed protein product [Alopecurus aequalis]